MKSLTGSVVPPQFSSATPVAFTSPAPAAVPSGPSLSSAARYVNVNAGRSGLARMLSLNDAACDTNLSEAKQRLAALFSEQEPHLRQQDLTEASAIVDHYLNNNQFAGPISQDVRDLMVDIDADIHALHRAIPFGRGNVLIRHGDETGRGQNDIDFSHTFEKASLKFLGQLLYEKIEARRGDIPLQLSTKQAALSILTGSASCIGYLHTLALMVAQRCNLSPALKDTTHIKFCSNPKVSADGARIDHVYGMMYYTDTNGELHKIVMDPWTDKNRVLLEEHSKYLEPMVSRDSTYLNQVNDDTIKLIAQHMENASNTYLQKVGGSAAFNKATGENEYRVTHEHDSTKHYDVAASLAGYVDAPVDNAKPGVSSLPTRRASLESSDHSPFLTKQ